MTDRHTPYLADGGRKSWRLWAAGVKGPFRKDIIRTIWKEMVVQGPTLGNDTDIKTDQLKTGTACGTGYSH